MAKPSVFFKRLRWRRFLAAICFILVILLVCSFFFPFLIKRTGDGLLFFPEKLEIIQRVRPDEIAVVFLKQGDNPTGHLSPGKYYIYTDSMRLFRLFLTGINLSGESGGQKAFEWLRLVPAGKQAREIQIFPVTRGLRLYDTPYAKGRPIFSFTINDPGLYNLLFDIHGVKVRIDIAPDYTSGREWVFILSILCEISVVVIPITVYSSYRYRVFRSRRKSQQQKHRDRADMFMDLVKKKR